MGAFFCETRGSQGVGVSACFCRTIHRPEAVGHRAALTAGREIAKIGPISLLATKRDRPGGANQNRADRVRVYAVRCEPIAYMGPDAR